MPAKVKQSVYIGSGGRYGYSGYGGNGGLDRPVKEKQEKLLLEKRATINTRNVMLSILDIKTNQDEAFRLLHLYVETKVLTEEQGEEVLNSLVS